MLNGVVVKAYNSYYYVQDKDKVISCKLRGRFKKGRFSLMVGDEVNYMIVGQDSGIIEEILPRRGLLKRPAVANVDQVVLTFAAANPDINTTLVDKLLVLAEDAQLDIIVCINKIDLANDDEIAPLAELYQRVGYSVMFTSAKSGMGIEKLRNALYGKITAFAGPSGAGKSSLLNTIEAGLQLVTGEVSAKIGRGKHTTRFAELLPLSGGGFVVDTPGFSATEFTDIDFINLTYCFPEMAALASSCKFSTCLHDREPQCAVKQAVLEGKIAQTRYASYKDVLDELRANKKGY
jgi:ribosome biogenesis GTPase